MSDNSEQENHDIGSVPQSPVIVHAQYLKDFSFENPNAPESLKGSATPPEVDINIAVDTVRLQHPELKDFFEVVLTVEVNAIRDDRTLFIAELKYGAAISIHDVEEARHHPILFVEIPRTLFPFARMIISEATANGGFTPLQLGMVDFRAMYFQKFGESLNKNKNEAE